MEFTIDRSKWRCGANGRYAKGLGLTALENGDGFQCCLGQISLQLGAKQEDILGYGHPSEVNNLKKILVDYKGYDTHLSIEAMRINDEQTTTMIEKQKQLKELFKRHGHTIKFTGKSVKYEKV